MKLSVVNKRATERREFLKRLQSWPRARTRQGPRCGGVLLSVRATMLEGRATTLDLSENPHEEKTLMHLLRDLTAKWGHRFTI